LDLQIDYSITDGQNPYVITPVYLCEGFMAIAIQNGDINPYKDPKEIIINFLETISQRDTILCNPYKSKVKKYLNTELFKTPKYPNASLLPSKQKELSTTNPRGSFLPRQAPEALQATATEQGATNTLS